MNETEVIQSALPKSCLTLTSGTVACPVLNLGQDTATCFSPSEVVLLSRLRLQLKWIDARICLLANKFHLVSEQKLYIQSRNTSYKIDSHF